MQALELMKSHIVKIIPDATLGEAVDLMDLYQVSGLPVVDEAGVLVGMLTEHDVIRALLPEGRLEAVERREGDTEALVTRLHRIQELRVGDYMTAPAISVTETTDLLDAAALMLSRRLKRLPVTGEGGQVVGVLSRIDVCQAILEGNL
jgi:CBS domain-containing protein